MTTSRAAIALLAMVLGTASAAAQGRVTIAGDGSKELKRSAHRLRIPVERLRDARSVLREATDLARRLELAPFESFANLAGLWRDLDRESAPAVFDEIFAQLRSAASNASSEREYARPTAAAQILLFGIAGTDYERSEALARAWPEPPPAVGAQATSSRASMLDVLRGQTVHRLAYSNPDRALSLLEAGVASSPFGSRAAIVRGLAAGGRRDDAARLIDRAKAEFAAKKPDASLLHDYANFVGQIGQIAETDPQKALEAFRELARAAEAATGLRASTLRIGERDAALSPAESLLFNTIRSFSMRPDLVRRALDLAPGLRTKLDTVGGVDSALHPVQGRGIAPGMAFGARRGISSGGQLALELRGKATSDPGAVRRSLAETDANAEGINKLLQLAQQTSHDDPDLASIALETAATLVPRIEAKLARAGILQQLVHTYRQVEGEVDTNVLREGFILVDDLRQEWKERQAVNPDGSPRGGMIYGNPTTSSVTPADNLEAMLVSEYARDDFEGAMRFVRAMPDTRHKLDTLLRICQTQRNPY